MSTDHRPVVGIIQARMASSRLPGKVLLDLAGEPVLSRVYSRSNRANTLGHVLVATSSSGEDDAIAEFCANHAIDVFRGHPTDVLDRVYRAARLHDAHTVVRITADCPVIDPELIDETVRCFLQADPPVDFTANRLPGARTYPVGLDTEVCSIEALEQAWRQADQPYQREHVMPYLYEQPGRFSILVMDADADYSHLRWTLDTVEDLSLLRRIYQHFDGRDDFSWRDVLELVKCEPELALLNAGVPQKSYHDADPRFRRERADDEAEAGSQ